MLKKDTLGNASKKSLGEAFRCGECLHHKNHKHPSHTDLCHKEGVRTFAIAPACFTPDVTQIAANTDEFAQLALLMNSYTGKQQRILLGLMRTKPSKAKEPFGKKMYFLAFGRDYISNYLSGYVMGYTSSGELILGGSPEQRSRGKTFFAYMRDTDNLLNAKEWRAKKAELHAAGRVIDPNSNMKPRSITSDGEPPTLDTAPDAWHDKRQAQDRRTSNRRKDVVDMVTVIS